MTNSSDTTTSLTMKKYILLVSFLTIQNFAFSQLNANSDNYTNARISVGGNYYWAPITILETAGTSNNEGVALAFEGGSYTEMGYRFKANGSNYYQVLYDGAAINWKHYDGSSYIPKLSLTNSGLLGIGTTSPSAELEVKSTTNNHAEIHINSSTNGKSSIIRFQDAGTNTWGLLSNYPNPDKLSIYNYHNNSNAMVFDINGNVGIGTSNPSSSFKLSVNGAIRSKEVKVEANWSDFVFYENYKLPTLEEVEKHISEKGHLPEIPSEAEVTENGINLGEMDAKLLQKIEELTLYIIDLNKQVKQLKAENIEMKNKKIVTK